jgi:hypothetical protein
MKMFNLSLSGRSPHPRSSENSPFQKCTLQPDIIKNSKKSMGFFLQLFTNQTIYSRTGQKFPPLLDETSDGGTFFSL